MTTTRDNFLRNASREGHEWIPQYVHVSSAYWHEMREPLEDLVLEHPVLFPHFRKGSVDFDAGARGEGVHRKTDAWGCEWEYELDGLEGIVVSHPLADWDAFDAWSPPELHPLSDDEKQRLHERRERGEVVQFGTGHGFFFMRLYYLRGFDNFMMDVAMEDERLQHLVDRVAAYWEARVRPYLDAGIDVLDAADDLGTQTASMLGRKHFRRWLLPTYKKLYGAAREAGAHVFMHHDGFIMDIMDDIIESGVTIVNPQDLVNGVDDLAREVKGRVCIRIDIDRQKVLPFGSPKDVRDLVREEVTKLGSPAGGLEMVVGLYPPTPLENVRALLEALEEHRTYWVGR
jgi:uroporphyrinogen decarboxylase